MSRYKVTSDWRMDYENEPFTYETFNNDTGEATTHIVAVQVADITDQTNGRVYSNGAYRVVKASNADGSPIPVAALKPIKAGKGGTVPFYGESAWSDAARLFHDEVFAGRRLAWS